MTVGHVDISVTLKSVFVTEQQTTGTKVIIIMTLQPIVGPWPLFQFLDPIHSL
jgi:hypothetical protein